MRFSAAMATYNGAKFIRKQLDSLGRQSFLPAEGITDTLICDSDSIYHPSPRV